MTFIQKTSWHARSLIALSLGLYALLAGTTNLMDFDSNYQYVRHVLSMDTMKPFFSVVLIESRAVTSTSLHLSAYGLIIAIEILSGLLCFAGGLTILISTKHQKYREAGLNLFNIGAILGLALWHLGFCVIGGEWFAMWANEWNGLMKAYAISTYIVVSLIFINQQ